VLASDTEAAALFGQLCDFHLVEDAEEDSWFRTTTPHELVVFGADGAGGRFALAKTRTGDSLGVMYVSSEGQAGVIAGSIPDALALMIVFPYWHDCLKFSGGGLLAEMLRVQPLLEHDLATELPDIQRVRDQLLAILACSLEAAISEVSTKSSLLPTFQRLRRSATIGSFRARRAASHLRATHLGADGEASAA